MQEITDAEVQQMDQINQGAKIDLLHERVQKIERKMVELEAKINFVLASEGIYRPEE